MVAGLSGYHYLNPAIFGKIEKNFWYENLSVCLFVGATCGRLRPFDSVGMI